MTLPANVVIDPAGKVLGAGPPPLVGIPAIYTFGPNGPTQSAPQIVPLQPVAAQQLNVTLGDQACTLKVYFKTLMVPDQEPPTYTQMTLCFMDVYLNGSLLAGGVLCQNNNRIVRAPYLGFVGDLAFTDTQGVDDPAITGLGTRFLLLYWQDLP